MRQHRTIFKSTERPHSPKTPSSPAAADTLSALLEDLGAQPRDFDCIVTGDLGHIGADLITMCSLLRNPVCKFQKHYGNHAVEKNYDIVFLELT